jgi:hypothetical protein
VRLKGPPAASSVDERDVGKRISAHSGIRKGKSHAEGAGPGLHWLHAHVPKNLALCSCEQGQNAQIREACGGGLSTWCDGPCRPYRREKRFSRVRLGQKGHDARGRRAGCLGVGGEAAGADDAGNHRPF